MNWKNLKMTNLEFLGKVKAKKEHQIYKSSRRIYVLIENIKEGRGNFYILNPKEIQNIKDQIRTKIKTNNFYPKNVVDLFNGFYGLKNLKKKENLKESANYRLTRFSKICYYLVLTDFLTLKKEGNKIFFIKTKKLKLEK